MGSDILAVICRRHFYACKNGTVTALYNEFMELPIERREEY